MIPREEQHTARRLVARIRQLSEGGSAVARAVGLWCGRDNRRSLASRQRLCVEKKIHLQMKKRAGFPAHNLGAEFCSVFGGIYKFIYTAEK